MSVAIHMHTPPDQLVTQERAIATVEAHVATLKVPRGIAINDIPLEHRNCQLALIEGAKRWIARMQTRGYHYEDFYDVHVYGPWSSYDFSRNLRDLTELNTDPASAAGMVKQRPLNVEEFADYRLVANFTARPTEFDNPVVIDTGKPGGRSR